MNWQVDMVEAAMEETEVVAMGVTEVVVVAAMAAGESFIHLSVYLDLHLYTLIFTSHVFL